MASPQVTLFFKLCVLAPAGHGVQSLDSVYLKAADPTSHGAVTELKRRLTAVDYFGGRCARLRAAQTLIASLQRSLDTD